MKNAMLWRKRYLPFLFLEIRFFLVNNIIFKANFYCSNSKNLSIPTSFQVVLAHFCNSSLSPSVTHLIAEAEADVNPIQVIHPHFLFGRRHVTA
jgi:hypothetical protein